jgi:hypothetical protein
MIQAGAHPITSLAFGCELMRNWKRADADRLRTIFNWYFHTKRHLGLGDAALLPSVGR